jgi:hypothetical protein
MTTVMTYEEKLSRFGTDWALREASMHFEEKSAVHQTMRRIAKRLNELGIPYAVVGGMALFLHGFRRFTEDVDILVTAEGLAEIHRQLTGWVTSVRLPIVSNYVTPRRACASSFW